MPEKLIHSHQSAGKRSILPFDLIAGPCALDNTETCEATIKSLLSKGVVAIRCFTDKARTSSASFQGIGTRQGTDAIRYYKKKFGDFYACTEILTLEDAHRLEEDGAVAIAQIGARNMYNYPLIRRCAECFPFLVLKRASSATLKEWVEAGLYATLAEPRVELIFCERGIRTFNQETRYTLDLGILPALKEMLAGHRHAHIFVDPSHAQGKPEWIPPLANAAKSMPMVDGLELEFYDDVSALCDWQQAMPTEWLGTRIKWPRLGPCVVDYGYRPHDFSQEYPIKPAKEHEHGKETEEDDKEEGRPPANREVGGTEQSGTADDNSVRPSEDRKDDADLGDSELPDPGH